MPVTQWFTDTVPGSTGDAITVVVGDQQARIPISDLDRGDRVRAVLDCTGGWYAAQDWAGVRLDRLLSEVTGKDLPDGGSVDVISRTGYRRRLPLRDAPALLLATSAAGQAALGRARSAGAAGRAGETRLLVGQVGGRIEVVDAPWWRQPPFPLQ